jgi:uncharacterized phage-associated protein
VAGVGAVPELNQQPIVFQWERWHTCANDCYWRKAMHLSPKDRQKAVEAILLVAGELPTLTKHTLAKVFYFADKEHLRKYGRIIIKTEWYAAMRNGPVPSGVYDIIRNIGQFAQGALEEREDYYVHRLRAPDMQYLSESEIECLIFSAREYGHRSFDELTRLSHDYAWKQANENDQIALEDIAQTVPDSDQLIAYLRYGS